MTLLRPLKSDEEISTAGKLIKTLNHEEVLKSSPLLMGILQEREIGEDATNAMILFYQYIIMWIRRAWGDLSSEDLMKFFGSWLATVEPNISKNKFHKYWQATKRFLNSLHTRGILDAMHFANLTRAIYDWRQNFAIFQTASTSNAAGYIPEIFLQAPLFPITGDCSALSQQTYKDWVCLFTLTIYRPVFWMYWQRRIASLGNPYVAFNPTLFLNYWDVEFSGVIHTVTFAFQQTSYQERGLLNASALRHSLHEDHEWIYYFMDKSSAGNVEGGGSLLKECINRLVDFFISTPARLCRECLARCYHQGANPCPFFQQMNPQFFCQKLPEGWEHLLPPIPSRAR